MMQQPLYDIYCKIKNEKSQWFYYHNSHLNESNLKFGNSKQFIKDYLCAGGKFELLKDMDKLFDELEEVRADHIVSAFLFGIKLNEVYKIVELDKEPTGIINPELYTWFLTCLYHDIGYIFESKSGEYKYKKLEDMIKDKNFEYCRNLSNFELGKAYFKYRKNNWVIDHGVIGGFRLYAILQKIFNAELKGQDYSFDFEKNLLFSKQAVQFHKQAAEAIVRHNMWLAKPDENEKYRKAGLEDLICSDNSNKIGKKDGVLFLLTLSDVLEPIKRFSCINREELLKMIFFEFSENSIEIILDSKLRADEYFNPINDLTQWMDVNVNLNEIVSSNKIIININ